jgi:hypothetical protein
MKIILIFLIFAKTSCQEDNVVKFILSSSTGGVLAGGIYGSTVLLDESANYAVSKIKSLSDAQKFYLKKSLVLAGTFGISKALGFSNEGAAVITGSSAITTLIASRIKKLKDGSYNIESYASAATAGLITTGSCYQSLCQTSALIEK